MCLFQKLPNGALVPMDDEAMKAVASIKSGDVARVKVQRVRNPMFHRKFFSLLNVGFEAFEPVEQLFKGLPVQKNFERFRKDCVISAGYYDAVANINGDVRAEAQSISFSSMDQEEFEGVYSKVADVLLQKVLRNYTKADLDRVVNNILRYVG